jgi:hypothetical protein
VIAAVTLFFFAMQSTTLLEKAIRLPLGVSDEYEASIAGAIAVALVALAARRSMSAPGTSTRSPAR